MIYIRLVYKAGPGQSQAVIDGFGLAWGLTKPEPPQAKPKLGLSGQAGPEQHYPLHNIITSIKENPPRKHASPIANLLRIHKLSNIRMESISPKAQLPRTTANFTTQILKAR